MQICKIISIFPRCYFVSFFILLLQYCIVYTYQILLYIYSMQYYIIIHCLGDKSFNPRTHIVTRVRSYPQMTSVFRIDTNTNIICSIAVNPRVHFILFRYYTLFYNILLSSVFFHTIRFDALRHNINVL